jgi:hypothetical protein
LFLSEPIRDAETFYATWYALKVICPAADDSCKDPSRYYWAHSGVYSISDEGRLVEPVKPRRQMPKTLMRKSKPEGKGLLSQTTLSLLANGIEPGGRNIAVYKAAKDFQQQQYELEEAEERIIEALHEKEVLCASFTEREARTAIRSAYRTRAKHDPRTMNNRRTTLCLAKHSR